MWYHCIKMEFQKIFSIQPLMIKIYQDLLLKNGFKFMINQEEIEMLTEKLESKHQFQDLIYVILMMCILL